MAEKILNTRLKLKIDTLANWAKVEETFVPLRGEVCIIEVPTGNDSVTTAPSCLIKVGDGTKTLKNLKYISALAADVHAYAKKSETEFIAWVKQIISTEGAYDAQGSAAQALADAKAYTDELANGAVTTNTNAIAAIKDGTTIDSFNDVETALAGKEASGAAAQALADAKTYADGKDVAIAAAKKAGDDAQTAVNALEAKVGTVTPGKTVVEMIADAQTAATYDDTALKGRVKTIEDDYLRAADKTELQGNINSVSGKVTTLIGEDASKSARTIASEEVAKIVAGADAAYDTLKEISDWISGHKTDAAAMNSAITALEAIVDGIGGEGEKATVVDYVTDAIAALKIGDYAKASDLTALAARVTTAEGKLTTLTGGDTVEGSVRKALKDAKTYADGLNTAMNTRVGALESIDHEAYKAADTALHTAISAEIDSDVKVVNDALTAYKTSNDAAVAKKANDADLAAIAKSGNVKDLNQTAGDVLVFDCGSSTVNV